MKQQSGNSIVLVLGLVCVVALVGYASWQLLKTDENNGTTEPMTVSTTEPDVSVQEVVQEQVEEVLPEPMIETIEVDVEEPVETVPEVTLPSLENSDSELLSEVKSISLHNNVSALLANKEVIQKLVVFADNLSRGDVAREYMPFIAPMRRFSVVEDENKIIIDENSYKRYDAYVELINSIEPKQVVGLYRKYQPLVQEALAHIGYPNKNFDENLLDAIEQVLETPVIEGDIELVIPKVMYQFKDEDLESLSGVQKQALRMGSENLKSVKVILNEYKQLLEAAL